MCEIIARYYIEHTYYKQIAFALSCSCLFFIYFLLKFSFNIPKVVQANVNNLLIAILIAKRPKRIIFKSDIDHNRVKSKQYIFACHQQVLDGVRFYWYILVNRNTGHFCIVIFTVRFYCLRTPCWVAKQATTFWPQNWTWRLLWWKENLLNERCWSD